MDMQFARNQMVQQQVRAWDVLDLRILSVFENLPREQFVPTRLRNLAYADTRIPLGQGEVMMAPKVEGRVLQALNPQSGESALEVGTGSGFLAACLSKLAGEVLSWEIRPEFSAAAGKTLTGLGIRNVKLEVQDGTRLGELSRSFDCIAVTGSLPAYDKAYQERLKVGGRLFAIVGRSPVMEARLVTRVAEDAWSEESLFETDLPSLQNAYAPRLFRF